MGHSVRRSCGFLLPLIAMFALFGVLQPARMRALLADFSPRSLAIVLCVLLLRELLKAVRWSYYLRAAGVPISTADGMTNFLAGQAVGVLPLGEVLRARLLREHGIPAYEVIPVVTVQIACDVVAFALIALIGAYRGIIVWWLAAVPLLLPVALAAVFSSDRLAAAVGRMLRRHRATARFVPVEDDVRAHTLRLLRPRPFLCGIAFSLVVTAASGFVLFALVDDLSRAMLGWSDAIVANALSTLAGLVSLVPGGLGVTDGSLGGLLSAFGVGAGMALSVALVYRFLDSLFRTLVGMVTLFARYRALFFDTPADEAEPQLQPVPVDSAVGRE
jgi:uncharacterized membrane protein YbhN (UPF0104 family)